MRRKINFFHSPPVTKRNNLLLKSIDLQLPHSLLTKSNTLLKTLTSFESLKLKTFKNQNKKKNKIGALTIKDDEFISSRYITENPYDQKEINTKYSFHNNLNDEQKTCIQSFFKTNHKKNKSITTHSVKNEKYTNPFNSQHMLNFNNQIYNILNNIRMESQYNSYSKKINDIHKKEKLIKSMPKILISKISNSNNNEIKESKTKKILRLNTSDTLPLLNRTKILSREDYLSQLSIKKKIIETLHHPLSRGEFSLCKIEDNTLFLYGGIQSKFLNDIWKCKFSIEKKKDNKKVNFYNVFNNKITIKWEEFKINEDNSPIPRYGHSMTSYLHYLFIFGGTFPKNNYKPPEDNIVIFDTRKEIFLYPKCYNSKKIPFRKNHIACSIGSSLLIHGGIDYENNYLNDIWYLDCLKFKWNNLSYKSLIKIPKIAFHTCTLVIKNNNILYHKDLTIYKIPDDIILTKGKIDKIKIEGVYIFGGINRETEFNNKLWLIRIGVKPVDIVEIPTFGKEPEPRINCSMCFYEKMNFLCIYGGKNIKLLNDFWILDLECFTYIKPIYNNNEILEISEHVMICEDECVIVLGGFGVNGYFKFDFKVYEFYKENGFRKEE